MKCNRLHCQFNRNHYIVNLIVIDD